MSYKPADFFLGVVDLFGVLLPGVLLTGLLSDKWPGIAEDLGIEEPDGRGWLIIGFLVAGYVLGHLLRALGEILDRLLFDGFYVPAFMRRETEQDEQTRNDGLWLKSIRFRVTRVFWAAARTLVPPTRKWTKRCWKEPDRLRDEAANAADLLIGGPGIKRNAFTVAEAYVAMRSSDTASEVARLQADSKFFRSLSIIGPIAIVRSWGSATMWLTAGLTFVALHQFLRLRWKAMSRLYQAFLLLHHDRMLGRGAATDAQEP